MWYVYHKPCDEGSYIEPLVLSVLTFNQGRVASASKRIALFVGRTPNQLLSA